ncbi:MAG: hypothetical protein R2711_03575 [Acidimicrobiales bacterium]
MKTPTTGRRRAALVLLLAAIGGSGLVGSGARAGAEAARAPSARKVLVISVPGVTWDDLRGRDLPALRSVLADASLAGLAPRSTRPRSGPGDGYLTLSAGSRAATVVGVDGQVLGLDEEASGSGAGEIFQRRTGAAPEGEAVALAWPGLVRANARQPYGTEIGALADALAEGGASIAAIGNADGLDTVGESYERQVGLAAADGRGVVAGGALGPDLLVADPTQPFGERLNLDVVTARFERAWSAVGPGVVLVEGSDLARALRYRPLVDDARYDEMWSDALRATDALIGRLLPSVDLDRDAVVVVTPYPRAGDRDLTAVGVRPPGGAAGYLRSASTQRAGFLTLVDLAPTFLDQLGLPRPESMEGRPAVVERDPAPLDDRIDHLVELNRASRFREHLLAPTSLLAVVGGAAVVAAAIAAHANGWSARARAAIGLAARAVLAVLPASYLVRPLPLEDLGGAGALAVVAAVALAVAVLATVAGRGRFGSRRPLVVVLGLVAAVLVVDVTTGSHLSLSAAFGYSATGNSRLYGISNYSYAQLAAAACLLASWVALIVPGRRGVAASTAVMGATIVVLGVPVWGADVGGVLAFTPAAATFWFSVRGARIRARTLLAGAVAALVAIAAFGALDLARPADDRGHLGRLLERIGAEGLDPLASVAHRKLIANLEVSTASIWVLAIPVAALLWWFLRHHAGPPSARILAAFPTLRAGLHALVVAAVLGSLLNDSGAIIGGLMALVASLALADRLVALEPPAPVRADGDAPG